MTKKGPIMRIVLVGLAVMALAACGQSGGSGKAASGGGGQSATIAEGTISDAMIDLSASESYGATSTVDESAPTVTAEAETAKPKAEGNKQADDKPKKEDARAEAPDPAPAKSDEEAGDE